MCVTGRQAQLLPDGRQHHCLAGLQNEPVLPVGKHCMADRTPCACALAMPAYKLIVLHCTLQESMSALYSWTLDHTPAGEIADNSLEFKFDAENRLNMRSAWPIPLQAAADSPLTR